MALLEIDINITAFNTFVQVTPKKLIFIARVPQRLVLDQVLSNASFNSVLVLFWRKILRDKTMKSSIERTDLILAKEKMVLTPNWGKTTNKTNKGHVVSSKLLFGRMANIELKLRETHLFLQKWSQMSVDWHISNSIHFAACIYCMNNGFICEQTRSNIDVDNFEIRALGWTSQISTYRAIYSEYTYRVHA